MSNDFLSNFNKENYNKNTNNNKKKIDAVSDKEEKKTEEIEKKDDIDKLDITTEEKILDNSKKNYEKHVIHDVVVDESYSKKQKKKYIIIASFVTVAIIVMFLIFKSMNEVQVINLISKNIDEVNTWALKNKITLDITKEFNDEYNEDIIFYQSKKDGSKISKGSVLKITVSKGSDPDVVIEIPDFSSMTNGKINDWVDENHLMNTNVVYSYSDEIEKNSYIKHVFKDDSVSNDYFKRSDYLTIYLSKGKAPLLTNINVPDFAGKTKEDVDTWATTNKVVVNYKYESATVPKNQVVSQSIKANNKINEGETIDIVISTGEDVLVPDFTNQDKNAVLQWATSNDVTVKYAYEISNNVSKDSIIRQVPNAYSKKTSTITIVLSLGKEIIVPDFSAIYKEDAINVGTDSGLNVKLIQQYRNDKTYGQFISQSIGKKTTIREGSNTNIDVYYSLGKPYIENYSGLTQKDVTETIYELNKSGANLKYEFVNIPAPDDESIGKIANVCYIDNNNCYTTINMYIDVGLTLRMEVYR